MKTLLLFLLPALFIFNTDLEPRLFLNGKIEMLVPKEFKEMSPELIAIKYPGKNRPQVIFTDKSGTVNLAFSHLENEADSTVIEAYQEGIKASYKKNFPTATWVSEGIAYINGKKIGFLKLVTQALDQKMYNHLFITDLQGKLLIGTFNCTEKEQKKWTVTSEQMIHSLKLK